MFNNIYKIQRILILIILDTSITLIKNNLYLINLKLGVQKTDPKNHIISYAEKLKIILHVLLL